MYNAVPFHIRIAPNCCCMSCESVGRSVRHPFVSPSACSVHGATHMQPSHVSSCLTWYVQITRVRSAPASYFKCSPKPPLCHVTTAAVTVVCMNYRCVVSCKPFSFRPFLPVRAINQLRFLPHGDREALGREPELRTEEARRRRGL